MKARLFSIFPHCFCFQHYFCQTPSLKTTHNSIYSKVPKHGLEKIGFGGLQRMRLLIPRVALPLQLEIRMAQLAYKMDTPTSR